MTQHQRLTEIRVLVVDDDPDILEVMEIAFSSEGAAVSTANTGDDAVTRYTADQPELVVLDMMLPKRSGFLVLERIQQDDTPPR